SSTSDPFHEDLRVDDIIRPFAVMLAASWHTFQVLTKRPDRMRALLLDYDFWHEVIDLATQYCRVYDLKPPQMWNTRAAPNIWLGTSIENQPSADERLPDLRATPAARRFVSAEPLLSFIDLGDALLDLDWVIVGGESGHGARAMHPDWARSLRDQCTAVGVPFFFKQWGEWAPVTDGTHTSMIRRDSGYVFPEPRNPANCDPIWAPIARLGKKAAGRQLDGRFWNEMPINSIVGRAA
ncbi:DUF5131 family protein, partial [Azospirillum sp. B4]|uniref:DUF5131 family protein n=1 Tax=Azospirillum sp. B4 TaxID=95605 RepID=UPI0005CA3078